MLFISFFSSCSSFFLLHLAQTLDPCKSYQDVGETDTVHEIYFRKTPLITNDVQECDLLTPTTGWYRPQFRQASDLSTTCADRIKCGTIYPVWMTGHTSTTASTTTITTITTSTTTTATTTTTIATTSFSSTTTSAATTTSSSTITPTTSTTTVPLLRLLLLLLMYPYYYYYYCCCCYYYN